MPEAATAKDFEFPSTHWSSVLAAGETESEQGRHALGALLQRYQPCLKAYLILKFHCDEEQAADLFQSFVQETILEKGLIAKARPMKGHQFRSFLLTALHNFAASKLRRDQAKKRQPAGGLESLEDAEAVEVFSTPPPAAMFDVLWARWVVAKTIQRMQTTCHANGRDDVWNMFEARLKGPILDGKELVPYPQLVERLGLKSPTQAQNLLVTAKRTFGRCLRSVIADYVSGPEAIEIEVRELQIVLSHGG